MLHFFAIASPILKRRLEVMPYITRQPLISSERLQLYSMFCFELIKTQLLMRDIPDIYPIIMLSGTIMS